jgi:threonine aldolase
MSLIDLRSDTVTKPDAAMRAAMASAEVGDDVYGEDPSVNRLQETVAALLGKEAALYVPSGSMANQISLRAHTSPGDDVVIGEGAHNYLYESGAGGAIAGVQFTIAGRGGVFSAADLAAAYKPDNHHFAPTTLVCVENTHNRGGGRLWDQAEVLRITEWAHTHGLRAHLDGARLWNAHVATGRSLAELAAPFDSACVCLSKGLGAPIGSLVAGDRAFIAKAHRFRKMFGGGMRQAGILAAAGLHAIAHNVARLAEDHANARVIAERVGAAGAGLDEYGVHTNIVNFNLSGRFATAGAAPFVAAAREGGVLLNAIGAARVRVVTHKDVSAADCARAADVLATLLSSTPR